MAMDIIEFLINLVKNPTETRTEITGNVYITGKRLSELPDNLLVKGNVYLNDTLIDTLPKNFEVTEGLYIADSPLKSLPECMKVGTHIVLIRTDLEYLPDDLHVKGSLNLQYSEIDFLPENLRVDEELILEDTQILCLPESLVASNVYIADYQCLVVRTPEMSQIVNGRSVVIPEEASFPDVLEQMYRYRDAAQQQACYYYASERFEELLFNLELDS